VAIISPAAPAINEIYIRFVQQKEMDTLGIIGFTGEQPHLSALKMYLHR
jgi:hypothetical protein